MKQRRELGSASACDYLLCFLYIKISHKIVFKTMLLEAPWAPLDQTSIILIKIFSFCPGSSLEQWGLQYSPSSRVTTQALPGSLLALPLTEQFYLALLTRLHFFQLLFLVPLAVFYLYAVLCSVKKSNSVSLFVENTDFYEQYNCDQCLGELMGAKDSPACWWRPESLLGLSLAIRGHGSQCQALWGSALLPSEYYEECAGKMGHLYRALAFPSILLPWNYSQTS